jgi:hypothetical protein
MFKPNLLRGPFYPDGCKGRSWNRSGRCLCFPRPLHAVLVILVQSSISAKPGEAALHNLGEACDLDARCRRLTICSFQASWRSRWRASSALWCPASAMTVRMFGNNGLRPPSNRAAALRSEMSAGSTLACDQQPEGVHQNMALAACHALVRIESANAAAFCGLYRLTVHNDD